MVIFSVRAQGILYGVNTKIGKPPTKEGGTMEKILRLSKNDQDLRLDESLKEAE